MTMAYDKAADPLPWLLEASDPGPRYLAMRDLLGLAHDDHDLVAARRSAHTDGPIRVILEAMEPDGYWSKPGPGYLPKYYSIVWSLIALAQLGATIAEDARIATAASYILDQALTPDGQFGASGTPGTTVDCLQGNLCWALLELGCDDPRLESAFDWMARSVTGDGVAEQGDKSTPVRYYAGKCGPRFLCGANNSEACAWGGVKVVLAFGRLPAERRTPRIQEAVEEGVAFLLADDPSLAPYPNGYAAKPSGNWWKFGFPVFYVTDILQIIEALVAVGRGGDERLAGALELVRGKQDGEGRWALEYSYAGKTWADFGAKGAPSKWVTIRALRALRGAAA